MSQERSAEKKNRFQISREVQEDFVNSVAENMLALAEKAQLISLNIYELHSGL